VITYAFLSFLSKVGKSLPLLPEQKYTVRDEVLNICPRYDNVLLGQDYRTPRGAVIVEYEVVMELLLAGENRRVWRKAFPVPLLPPRISLEIPRD
jgi:hypothetical protein